MGTRVWRVQRSSHGCAGGRSGETCGCIALVLLLALGLCSLPAVQAQGLVADHSLLGASERMKLLDNSYKAAMQRAGSLKSLWSTNLRQACRTGGASLCGSSSFDTEQARDALLLATSPMAFDSRDAKQTGGTSPISPPGDQGECNACVAFSVAAAAEAAIASGLKLAAGGPRMPRLSPRDLFFCGGAGDEADCLSGWTFNSALAELTRRKSLASWDCLPFTSLQNLPLQDICTASPSCGTPVSQVGSFSWTKVQPLNSIGRVQQHIREWGGVVTRINLQQGFRSWFQGANKTKIYDGLPSDPSTDQAHAALVVGYDNNERFWIIKNSWGTSWADGGFAKVRYGLMSMMDPLDTFGVSWRPGPDTKGPPPPQLLPIKGAADCYTYNTRPGDYVSKVARTYDITTEALLTANAVTIDQLGSFLPPATPLKICGPKRLAPGRGGGTDAPPEQPPTPGGGGGGTDEHVLPQRPEDRYRTAGLMSLSELEAALEGAPGPAAFTSVAKLDSSSVQVAPGPGTTPLYMRLTLGPCAALMPHVHNGSEVVRVVSGTLHTAIVNDNNSLVRSVLPEGSLFQAPTGKTHFIYNPSCDDEVIALGAFDALTTTQLLLQFTSLIPPEALQFFTAGPLPKVTSTTPPLAASATCLARCKSGEPQPALPEAPSPPASLWNSNSRPGFRQTMQELHAALEKELPSASAYTAITPAGRSSVQVAPAQGVQLLFVKYVLGPCTAIQPHVHNGSEVAQVLIGTANIAVFNSKNELEKTVLKAGAQSQVPVGKLHYLINPGCSNVTILGSFDYGTTTEFVFQTTALIQPEELSYFTSGPLPKLQSATAPFAQDPKCVAKCGG